MQGMDLKKDPTASRCSLKRVVRHGGPKLAGATKT